MVCRVVDAIPTTIAVDAAGGYGGPEPVVRAVARMSLQSKARTRDAYFTLVGDETAISQLLLQTRHNPERISVADARTVVPLEEPPHRGLESNPGSSIERACELVASGEAQAVVTTGNPGAAVLSAFRQFDMIPGIERAALGTVFPTPLPEDESRFSLILDVGATVHATADDLVKFAHMGAAYARMVTGKECPRVALLSMTREPNVGPPEVVAAHERLVGSKSFEFVGNIEGHRLPRGEVDVVVCEGFVGDIVIKVLEGFADTAFDIAENAYRRRFTYRVGLRLLSQGLEKIKTAVDFEEYGGAPLLGIDEVLIVADPRSGTRAIENAIKLALKSVKSELPVTLAESLR